jgi:hypothetical protein
MKTRLERVLDALGWQGGTVHQAQDELTKMGLKGWEILEDSPASFEHLLELIEHKVKQKNRMKELNISFGAPKKA